MGDREQAAITEDRSCQAERWTEAATNKINTDHNDIRLAELLTHNNQQRQHTTKSTKSIINLVAIFNIIAATIANITFTVIANITIIATDIGNVIALAIIVPGMIL